MYKRQHEAPLAVAKQVGATSTVRVGSDPDGLDQLAADIAIESSGNPAGLRTCVYGVDRGGLVVGLGLLPPGDTPVAANALITRELRLVGSFRFDDELTEVLRALADGRLPVEPVVTSVLPVADALEGFGLAADPARSCKVLLDFGAV